MELKCHHPHLSTPELSWGSLPIPIPGVFAAAAFCCSLPRNGIFPSGERGWEIPADVPVLRTAALGLQWPQARHQGASQPEGKLLMFSTIILSGGNV